MAGDPANLVQLELRPHIHLVSSFRCESKGDPFGLNYKEIAQLLTRAATETKGNDESWCWKMLEAPRDRTAFIVWQSPLQLSGRQFPSDGYVWADIEEASLQQIDGLKLECYRHRSGYVPSYEQYTLHARTRYRLLPASGSSTLQNCDACLWLVLYHRAEKSRVLHIRKIPPLSIQNQKIVLDQRRMIFQNGIPKSKDFVWEDRGHWPDIKFPQNQVSQRSFGSNIISRSQQGPFLAGQQLLDPRAGPPSSKRLKQNASTPSYVFPTGEDDGGSGDVMDVLIPRDISRLRYKQHAEWMEELYASPYPVANLCPVSLGIGRSGDLATLGAGIGSIDTPTSIEDIVPAKKISSSDFNQYVKNAHETIRGLESEVVSARGLHLKRLSRVQRGSTLRDAEKILREAAHLTHSNNPSSRHNNTSLSSSESADIQRDIDVSFVRQADKFDTMTEDLQQRIVSRVEPLRLAELVSKGGLEEKIAAAPAAAINGHPDRDEVTSQMVTSRSPISIGPAGVNSPPTSQTYQSNIEDVQDSTHPDDDYVMIDKSSHVSEQLPDDTMDTNEGQESGDGVDGDEFLNFDGENHENDFDSMFTDAMGPGDGAETPDDAATEGLSTGLGPAASSEHPIFTDSIPRPPIPG